MMRCQILCSMRLHCVSKTLTPDGFLIGQIIAECHSFPNMFDML